MIGIVTALRWVARLDGLVALILGVLLWSGSPATLKTHIMTGFIMSTVLLLLGLIGFFARIKFMLPLIAILWALLLPWIGFAQFHLFPGSSHIVIQIVHALIGIFSIGVCEAVGAKITRESRV